MNKLIPMLVLACMCCTTACHARPSAPAQEPAADSVEVKVLTKAEFLTKVINFERDTVWNYLGEKPAVIDFYADWCGPCKSIAPILKDLAQVYRDQVVFYKVNVDNEAELAALFGISSIPRVLLVPMKGTPNMIQGAVPRQIFEKAINEVLLKKE